MERPPSTPPKRWPLTNERLTIGRDPLSDVVIDDPRVSRHHADLRRQGPGWSIVDFDSANGTFVNGTRVTDTPVQPGDRIGLGDAVLVLAGDDDATHVGPSPLAAAPVGTAPPPPPPLPPPAAPPAQPPAVGQWPTGASFVVRSQTGNNENIGRDKVIYDQRQWVEHKHGALDHIASLRGKARFLLVSGVVLYLAGTGLAMAAVLMFQKEIWDLMDEPPGGRPDLPDAFFPMFGGGAFLCLIGLALAVFGLIVRSGTRREERWLEADVRQVEGWHG